MFDPRSAKAGAAAKRRLNSAADVNEFSQEEDIGMSRVIWIVLDSVGMGEAPDAADFGDQGADTIGHIMDRYPDLKIPNLRRIGYGHIDGIHGVKPVARPEGAFGRLREMSAGKDTTIGHWEMVGIYTPERLPVYPDGFSEEIISAFIEKTGVPGILCNGVASGTEVINRLGEEHRRTRKPIVYTSADSVFQIACDESVYPPEELYRLCRAAREILTGKDNVARVIARPFVKKGDTFVRTANRRDFSRKPDENNLLTRIRDAGQRVYAIGKIEDIFAGVGITDAIHTVDNEDGMERTMEALDRVESGLIFTNLVEFDSVWGHRRDIKGYAEGLESFDRQLGLLMDRIGFYQGRPVQDTIVITADHGCDPTFHGTDHTREYVPFLLYGSGIRPGVNLGTSESFADSGQTVLELLGLKAASPLPIGVSRCGEILVRWERPTFHLNQPRFLKLMDLSPEEIAGLLDLAADLKARKKAGVPHAFFPGKNIALIFEKTSTRTRCAFEVAAHDLGMHCTYLDPSGSQIGKKESIADTARVLGRMFDGIEYRGYGQSIVEDLSRFSGVPVWNGLTNEFHPTQILADFLTIREHFGTLKGIRLVYMGDARYNMGNSLMVGCAKMGLHFVACAPEKYWPNQELVETCREIARETGAVIELNADPKAAAAGAQVIYTDVWVSMGESESVWQERIQDLLPYRVTGEIMNAADPKCVFMHCLPAFHDLNTAIGRKIHEQYGLDCMEVEDAVFEGPRSIVFDEAENRMHTIKAVMAATL